MAQALSWRWQQMRLSGTHFETRSEKSQADHACEALEQFVGSS